MPAQAEAPTTRTRRASTFAFVEVAEETANHAYALTSATSRSLEFIRVFSSEKAPVRDVPRTDDEVIWGPALVDDLTLAAMNAVREHGYVPLPAEPLPLIGN
jgi:hypothetical protein